MNLLQAVPPVPPPVPSIPVDPNMVLSQVDGRAVAFIVLFVMAAITIVCWPIARALARRLEGKAPVSPALQGELDQMHQRLAEVDALQQRVAELEERLDFAERLLARGDSQATLPRGPA
jgi:Tfp pilus assembly protein PilO